MKDKIEEISFNDFEKKYLQLRSKWNFDLFNIVCKKCNSSNCEFAGETETKNGYYGAIDFEHKIIIKCHGCGNAFGMKVSESGVNNYCDCGN